jgi:hypothetical protein
MKIKHKYLRNRLFKIKSRNRAKHIVGGEFTFKTYFPFFYGKYTNNSPEEQLKRHQEYIDWWAYIFVNGITPSSIHAPSDSRRGASRKTRAAYHRCLKKINDGYTDVEFPQFRHDIDYYYF